MHSKITRGDPTNPIEDAKVKNPGSRKTAKILGTAYLVTFKENNIERSIYRDVNSGGSFGSNPLLQHIGIGQAASIEKIEVTWPVTGKVQVFENPPINTNIKITEGESTFSTYKLARLDFISKMAMRN